MEFVRRIGPDPHLFGDTPFAGGCPDIWELSDGSFAVIGLESTDALSAKLPKTASCGSDESVVIIPREILQRARNHIPQ